MGKLEELPWWAWEILKLIVPTWKKTHLKFSCETSRCFSLAFVAKISFRELPWSTRITEVFQRTKFRYITCKLQYGISLLLRCF